MNKLSDFEISLLGILVGRSMHGYQIHKELSEKLPIQYVLKLKIANLYAMLNKLENSGLIDASYSQEGKRPNRKIFGLTKKGSDLFYKWLDQPVQHGRDFRVIFLLKLFFCLQHHSSEIKHLISSQIDECNKWMKKVDDFEKNHTTDDKFVSYIVEFRRIQISSYMTWLQWCANKTIVE